MVKILFIITSLGKFYLWIFPGFLEFFHGKRRPSRQGGTGLRLMARAFRAAGTRVKTPAGRPGREDRPAADSERRCGDPALLAGQHGDHGGEIVLVLAAG